MPDKLEYQEIRARGMFPASLDLRHPDTQVVLLDNYMRRSMSMIAGIYQNQGYVARVDDSESLRIHAYGTGFRTVAVKAGTAPATYDGTEEIDDGNTYHRWDILIETEQAEISFLMEDGTDSGDIPLLVGAYSILFTSARCRIQKRGATAGTYTIVAYR